MGAAFLCTQFSISLEENRHPEYLKSWAKVLREDSKILWSAASKAQASLDYLLKLTGFDVAEVEDEEAVS